MVFIFFITSILCLSLFVLWKTWEENNGRKIILSEELLATSDTFIEKNIISLEKYYNQFFKNFKKIPSLLKRALEYLYRKILFLNKLIWRGIRKLLKSNNIMGKNGGADGKDRFDERGSASLFLKNISEYEQRKK